MALSTTYLRMKKGSDIEKPPEDPYRSKGGYPKRQCLSAELSDIDEKLKLSTARRWRRVVEYLRYTMRPISDLRLAESNSVVTTPD